MSKPSEALVARLKEYRARNGMTQVEMADKLNIPRSTYNFYESNKTVPDVNTLASISACIGISTDYLLGLNPPDKQTQESTLNTDTANALVKGFNNLINQIYGPQL